MQHRRRGLGKRTEQWHSEGKSGDALTTLWPVNHREADRFLMSAVRLQGTSLSSSRGVAAVIARSRNPLRTSVTNRKRTRKHAVSLFTVQRKTVSQDKCRRNCLHRQCTNQTCGQSKLSQAGTGEWWRKRAESDDKRASNWKHWPECDGWRPLVAKHVGNRKIVQLRLN